MDFFDKCGVMKVGGDDIKRDFLNVIPKLVSGEDNLRLSKPFKMNDLKEVIFGLGGDKALGPDGF